MLFLRTSMLLTLLLPVRLLLPARLFLWTGPGRAQADAGVWGVRPDGRPVMRIATAGSRAVVLFFVATDCPVSNRTFPEMKRLREAFAQRASAKQGVTVWFVYPNEAQTREAVQEHQRDFDADGQAVLDTRGRLTRLAGAIVTPEMAVLKPGGRDGWVPAYVGRVDDRYVRLGVERPAATEHFGEEAVEAVLAGRAVRLDPGTPVGCAIMNRGWRKAEAVQ